MQSLFSWNMLVCAEHNSGFILKSPYDDVLWYWAANLYKFCKCIVLIEK
jgi:hypothetical protein